MMTIREMVERTEAMNQMSDWLREFDRECEAEDDAIRSAGGDPTYSRVEARVCEACGCTDRNACIERNGEPCHWIEGYDGDLCSACAAVAVALLDGDPRVEIYSPAEGQAWIEETRAARMGAGI